MLYVRNHSLRLFFYVISISQDILKGFLFQNRFKKDNYELLKIILKIILKIKCSSVNFDDNAIFSF